MGKPHLAKIISARKPADALDGIPDERFHLGNDGCQRVAVIRLAWHSLHMVDELAAPGMR